MIVFRSDQEDIMKYRAGRMAIQAVPGAGKTFIITHLVAKLLSDMVESNIDGKILILTYMNSAVSNFKTRIRGILSEKNIPRSKFEVMTIHSLALSIIRDNTDIAFADGEFFIIDDYVRSSILDDVINDYRMDFFSKNGYDPVRAFINKGFENKLLNSYSKRTNEQDWSYKFKSFAESAIRLMKYEGMEDDIMVDRIKKRHDLFLKFKAENNIEVENYRGIFNIFVPIYNRYQQSLRNQGYMDYDDILYTAYKILRDNPDICESYQRKYRYIFEDECQDSNMLQGRIIDILSKNIYNNEGIEKFFSISKNKYEKNLVRIGDVNQSITGTFTGSNPMFFVDFCKNAEFYYNMDMSSRSSKDVIDLANFLVYLANIDKKDFTNKTYDEISNLYCKFTTISDAKIDYTNSLIPVFMNEVTKNCGYKENPVTDEYGIDVFFPPNNIRGNAIKEYNNKVILNKILEIKSRYPSYTIGLLCFSNNEVDDFSKLLTHNGVDYVVMGSDNSNRKKIITDVKSCIDFLLNPRDMKFFKNMVHRVFVERIIDKITSSNGYEHSFYNREIDVDNIIEDVDNYFRNVDIERWIFDESYYSSFKSGDCKAEVFDSKLSNVDELKSILSMDRIRQSIVNICNCPQLDLCFLVETILDEISKSKEESLLSKNLLIYVDNLVRFDKPSLSRLSISLDFKYLRYFDSAIDSIYESDESNIEAGSITVSTLHKSKGLEWDYCIISDMSQYKFPSSVSEEQRTMIKYLKKGYEYPEAMIKEEIDYFNGSVEKYRFTSCSEKHDFYIDLVKKDIINERIRLLYVGITRAKRGLYILCSNIKKSKFFDEFKNYVDVVKEDKL